MSRPARKGTGSNKSRPSGGPQGKPGAKSGAKPGAKPGAQPRAKPSTKPSAKENPGAKPAAKSGGTASGKATGAAGAGAPASRKRDALVVPGRSSWASSAPLPVLVASLAGLFLLGLLVGVGGAFVHYMRVGDLPTGTLLGVVAAGGVAFTAGMLLRSRMGAAIPSLGWLVAGLFLSSPRPEGDLLIAGNAIDYGFLVGGVATLLAVCALPYGLLAIEPTTGPAAEPAADGVDSSR